MHLRKEAESVNFILFLIFLPNSKTWLYLSKRGQWGAQELGNKSDLCSVLYFKYSAN